MDSAADTVTLENIINLQGNNDAPAAEKKKKKASTKKSKKTKQDSVTKTKGDGKKIHVRSVDASQVQQKFNKVADAADNATASLCKLCNKQVFQMERIKAERFVWHKSCFNCTECKKTLTVDTYNSHEGLIYCKPHFKQLFQPKAVLDSDEPYYLNKPEMIIRESQPVELPSDVVRASETSNYCMDELSNLDLKSRFTVFERAASSHEEVDTKEDHKVVRRSESILSKLARFDREKGSLRGEFSKSSGNLDVEDSSDEDGDPYAYDDVAGSRLSYLGPDNSVNFGSITDIKSKWEEDKNGGPRTRKEELARQRKEELKILRARQCQGRQLRLKEQYEQAAQEVKNGKGANINDLGVDAEKIKNIKGIFEKGLTEDQMAASERTEHVVDAEKLKQLKNMFENGGGELSSGERHERHEEMILGASTKEARNIFKQMEEGGFQNVHNKNKQQENYGLDNKETFKSTSAMLDLFRRLEKDPDRYRDVHDEDDEEEDDYEDEESGEENSDEEQASHDSEEDENLTVGLTPQQQELLQIARDRAVAKNMREKFERWEFSNDEEKLAYEKTLMIPDEPEEIQASLNTARNLRAHFENLQREPPKQEKPRIKVNRFV